MKTNRNHFMHAIIMGAAVAVAGLVLSFSWPTNDSVAKPFQEKIPPPVKSIQAPEPDGTAVRWVPQNFSALAAKISPAVVNIRTEKSVKSGPAGHFPHQSPFGGNEEFREYFERFFGRQVPPQRKQRSLGTGFIISQDGYIVTNNHVIEGADKISVALKDQDEELSAEIIGRDPQTDIALIKVNTRQKLPTAEIGNSEALQVGQWVVAIGNPFGLEHTVTAGIVSAKGRVIGAGPYDDYIQTDTSINPGNSGGPLINMQGEVVGINTMIIAGGQGIGFAIPIDLAKGIVDQLADSGEVTRGWLGVTIQDLKGDLAAYYGVKDRQGVLITDVVPGDPADQAGLQPKDIIVAINEHAIISSRDLTRHVADLKVGTKAQITYIRNGKKNDMNVKIAKRASALAMADTPVEENKDSFGFQVTDITPEMARRHNLPLDKGVVVAKVAPDGKAAQAGLSRGDVILEINHKTVTTASDLKKTIEKEKKKDKLVMLVQRPNAGLKLIDLS
jgi:serine protease Do